jgi:hypothetical protein
MARKFSDIRPPQNDQLPNSPIKDDAERTRRTLRGYEMDEIRTMWDAGVRDPDALFVGRASISPKELKNAALGGMYMDVTGQPTPKEYSGTDSPVGADLLNFFKESDNDLAGAVFDRVHKSERWLFPRELDPEASKQARNGYMADIRAGKPVEKGIGGFVKWAKDLRLTSAKHAVTNFGIDKHAETPIEKWVNHAKTIVNSEQKEKPLMLGGEEVTQEEMDYFHRQVDIQRQNSILNGNKGYPGYPDGK